MSEPPLISQEDLAAPCSDIGNAQMLYLWYHDSLRWIPAWQRWYAWDANSGRWVADVGAGVCAHHTAVELYNLSRERVEQTKAVLLDAKSRFRTGAPELVTAQERYDSAVACLRWYLRSQNDERQRGLLRRASNLPAFHTPHETFDATPHLFATASSTIDLRTGEAHAPAREDFITMGTSVAYDPTAVCPVWDAFLLQVMCGDPEKVSYLQRIAGYCLTASTAEHFLGFFYGTGANGKSTFLTLLAEIAGEYYNQAPRGLLFWAPFERHPTELVSLHKRRVVICQEVPENARLDEAKVKDLTGGDHITAHRMREDFWTFLPTHKLLIAGNHWFFVRGQDEGIWRRIHVVPWDLHLEKPEVDTEILPKLRAELPGILAWAVRGAAEWYAGGLAEPVSCARLRDQFRSDSDTFGQFWKDTITPLPDGKVSCDALYDAYIAWLQDHSHAVALGRRKFSARVRGTGATQGNAWYDGRTVWSWTGIRLSTAEERAAKRWGTDK